MPRLISREEAIARVNLERGEAPCLLCALRRGEAGPRYLLEETEGITVLLPRYARQWGHILILLNEHLTSFSKLSLAGWQEATAAAHRAARLLERTLRPLRCYVASLGAVSDQLPLSSPHLHIHVIPVYGQEDRPSTVLTTEHGVYIAEEEEWQALQKALLEGWGASG